MTGSPAHCRKPIIGLAGGIGSGKTTVALLFAQLGAGVISSDQLNHEELNSPEVLARLREWWGDRVVDAQGRADRDAIRGLVQRSDASRLQLERLMHPRIASRSETLMQRYQADDGMQAVVWDSPLLFEAGLAERCDCVVFVESSLEDRLARVGRERGWTREDLERFEKIQKSLDFKREHADYIVNNNSDIDAVRREVARVFSRILSAAETACR